MNRYFLCPISIFWVFIFSLPLGLYAKPFGTIPIKITENFSEKTLCSSDTALRYVDYASLDLFFKQEVAKCTTKSWFDEALISATYGLRFTLSNETDTVQSLVLELVSPFVVIHGLYHVKMDTSAQFQKDPFLYIHRNPVVNLHLPAHTTIPYTLLYTTTPERKTYFNLILWHSDRRIHHFKGIDGKYYPRIILPKREVTALILFIAFNFMLVIFGILQISITQDSADRKYYLYFLGYILSYFLCICADLGLSNEILQWSWVKSLTNGYFSDYPWLSKMVSGVLVSVNMTVNIFFLQTYLDAKKRFPKTYLFIQFLRGFILFLGVILLISMLMKQRPTPYFSWFAYFFIFGFSVLTIFVLLFKRNKFPLASKKDIIDSNALIFAVGLASIGNLFLVCSRLSGLAIPNLPVGSVWYSFHSTILPMTTEILMGITLMIGLVYRVYKVYQNNLAAMNILIRAKRKNEVNLFEQSIALDQRLSLYLHDDIGMSLRLISMEIDKIAAKNPAINPPLTAALADISALHKKIRNASHWINNETLMKLGLSEGLKELTRNVEKTLPNVVVTFFHIPLPELEVLEKNVIFQIARGALYNCISHANPKNISIYLVREEENLIMSIADDGSGFNQEILKSRLGIGLKNMQSVAEILVGGSLDVVSEEGKGTTVTATLPLKAFKLPESDSENELE